MKNSYIIQNMPNTGYFGIYFVEGINEADAVKELLKGFRRKMRNSENDFHKNSFRKLIKMWKDSLQKDKYPLNYTVHRLR